MKCRLIIVPGNNLSLSPLCLGVFSFNPKSFFTDEEISILKKFKLYVEDNWNKCDMVAMSLFVVGVSCRYGSHTSKGGGGGKRTANSE